MPGNVYMNAMRLPTMLVLVVLLLVVPCAASEIDRARAKRIDAKLAAMGKTFRSKESQWEISSSPDPATSLFTFVYPGLNAADRQSIHFGCNLQHDRERPLYLSFAFKDLDYSSWTVRSRRRNKKGFVHLQLGFWNSVRSEAGSDLVLRQETIDYDWPNRAWKDWKSAHYMKGHIMFYNHEAAGIARRMYRSESVSWTDKRTGEANSVEVGDKGRKAIEAIMSLCGFSVHESSATPTAVPDLSSRRP